MQGTRRGQRRSNPLDRRQSRSVPTAAHRDLPDPWTPRTLGLCTSSDPEMFITPRLHPRADDELW